MLDESVKGIFYEDQLQKVLNTDIVNKIEKILRTRHRNGVKENFVSWLGYPDKFNSWIPATNIVSAKSI